ESSLRLCGALERFLAIRGHLDEGRAWYDEALALPAAGLDEVRAKALYGAGALAAAQGDHAGAAAHFEANLAALRALGRRDAEALTLNRLGGVAASVGDYQPAERV